MRDATAITSMSEPFLAWALDFCNRPRRQADCVVPLVPVRLTVTDAQRSEAEQWWGDMGVDLTAGRCFSFVGSLSQAFDFTSLRGAFEQLQQLHPNCQLVICGTGAEENAIKSLFSGVKNVFFPGWIDASKLDVLMESSLATVAPYRNTRDFQLSIPNKVMDSFAHGRPVITSLLGEVQRLITDERVGIVCADTADGWRSAMMQPRVDTEYRQAMSTRAVTLYSENYEARHVYGGFAIQMEKLGAHHHG